MNLTKNKLVTEAQEFRKKFPKGKKSYGLTLDHNGNIISCDTTDKEILEYLSKLGLK